MYNVQGAIISNQWSVAGTRTLVYVFTITLQCIPVTGYETRVSIAGMCIKKQTASVHLFQFGLSNLNVAMYSV